MFHKALWMKEYKQSKFILWAFFLVSCYLPFQFMSYANQMKELYKTQPQSHYFYTSFFGDTALIQFLCVIVIAGFLVGSKRTNQTMEYALSLPFSRRSFYLTKWAIGAFTIFISKTVSTLVCFYILHTTILSKFILNRSLLYDYLTVLIVCLAIFTICLMVGYLTGSFSAQTSLSLIIILFPLGFYYLIEYFLEVHWKLFTGVLYSQANPAENVYSTIQSLTLPTYLAQLDTIIFNHQEWTSMLYLLIPLCTTLICFFIGLVLSETPHSEKNGNMILYPSLEKIILFGATFCFFFLGGAVVDGAMTSGPVEYGSIAAYYIGGAIFAFAAYLIMTKLRTLKLNYFSK